MNRPGQGRKPKPTPLKLLEGYKDKKRINKDEPKPKGKIPRCPKYLSKEARKEWRRMVKLLHPLAVLTELDGKALELYCNNWEKYMQCFQIVQDKGIIVKAPKTGVPMPNPYWHQMKKVESDIQRFLSQFGMTPADRTRIRVEKGKK